MEATEILSGFTPVNNLEITLHSSHSLVCLDVCIVCLGSGLSPDCGLASGPLQGVGVADQFVQHVDDLSELWPVGPLPLPTVQHELVQGHGAVHGRWQPIAFVNGLDHLQSRSV